MNMVLETFYKYFYRHMFSFLSNKQFGVEWVDCILNVCLTLYILAK